MPDSFLWNLQFLSWYIDFCELRVNATLTRSTSTSDTLGWPVCLPVLRLPVCSKLLYCVRIGLSVGGSVWYWVRNRRWTITIDLHLANCSTQNAFPAPVNAIFHQLPSSSKINKLHFVNNYEWKLGNILFPLIQVFSPCLPWLLFYRPMKPRKDFWLALYIGTVAYLEFGSREVRPLPLVLKAHETPEGLLTCPVYAIIKPYQSCRSFHS